MKNKVFLIKSHRYFIDTDIAVLQEKLKSLFTIIVPNNIVVLKPSWLAQSHKYNPHEWESVITHPTVITAVLEIVLQQLKDEGKVIITDGPQTDSSWTEIMNRMTPELWVQMGKKAGVEVEIMDLREDEWINVGDVTVERCKLSGDPKGSTEVDLGPFSEFVHHRPSSKGHYGVIITKKKPI